MNLQFIGLLKLGYPLEQLLTDLATAIIDSRYEATANEKIVASKLFILRNQLSNANLEDQEKQTNLPLTEQICGIASGTGDFCVFKKGHSGNHVGQSTVFAINPPPEVFKFEEKK